MSKFLLLAIFVVSACAQDGVEPTATAKEEKSHWSAELATVPGHQLDIPSVLGTSEQEDCISLSMVSLQARDFIWTEPKTVPTNEADFSQLSGFNLSLYSQTNLSEVGGIDIYHLKNANDGEQIFGTAMIMFSKEGEAFKQSDEFVPVKVASAVFYFNNHKNVSRDSVQCQSVGAIDVRSFKHGECYQWSVSNLQNSNVLPYCY